MQGPGVLHQAGGWNWQGFWLNETPLTDCCQIVERLPLEVMGSPSLEGFEQRLDGPSDRDGDIAISTADPGWMMALG